MDFARAFIDAWPRGAAEELGRFFSDEAVYLNGPLPPVTGREAIVATLREFMAMGGSVRVDFVHVVTEGVHVLTERVDFFDGDEQTIRLPVMGTFEIRNGVIVAWRDDFDLASMATA